MNEVSASGELGLSLVLPAGPDWAVGFDGAVWAAVLLRVNSRPAMSINPIKPITKRFLMFSSLVRNN